MTSRTTTRSAWGFGIIGRGARGACCRTGRIAGVAVLAAVLVGPPALAGSVSPLVVTNEHSPIAYLFDPSTGDFAGQFDVGFTEGDALAVADVYGTGFNAVLVAGDVEHRVDIFSPTLGLLGSFDADFTAGDGFAAGDVNGDGAAEVVVGGDDTQYVDVFDPGTGVRMAHFPGNFTAGDALATGDADGDGRAEVVIAGDETGSIEVYDALLGTRVASFGSSFRTGGGFAVADIDGDGRAEALVGRVDNENVEVYVLISGAYIGTFPAGFTEGDLLAAGDSDGDGRAEVAVFGDVDMAIDLFDPRTGTLLRHFPAGADLYDVHLAFGSSFFDTDGDGLADPWERFGIDLDGDGIPEETLPGANYLRKDIYLEVDYMDCTVADGDCAAGDVHTHRPKDAAIEAVIQAFADAPVDDNPDGSHGISLHIDVNQAIPHRDVLGFACFPADPGDELFQSLKDDPAYFGAASPRRLAYHYTVFAHRQAAGVECSGCSSGPSDFIVTLGGWHPGEGDVDNDGLDDEDVGTVMEQAGTLMHELGHNLGLPHGGLDAVNHKPNYLSIMNYSFQMTGIPPSGRLNYSYQILPSLDEDFLDESVGIGFVDENTAYYCEKTRSRRTGRGGQPIDWDCNGSIDAARVRTNINVDYEDLNANGKYDAGEPPVLGTLVGARDWDRLRLDLGTLPFASAGDGAPPPPPHAELDYDTYLQIRNLPPTADAGPDQTVECTGPDGATITLDASATVDPNGDPLTFVWEGPFGTLEGPEATVTLPLGRHEFTLTVEDGNGAAGTSTDRVVVTIEDTTPPQLDVNVWPTLLWPPNHLMVPIQTAVTAVDTCDPAPTVVLDAVTSNEPDNGLGDGDFPGDISGAQTGTDDRSFALRAERSGAGTGRAYSVRYRATDASQNSATRSVTVSVPHESK